MKKTNIILVVAALFAVGFLSKMDAVESQQVIDQHCELVELWNQDAARGIPPEQRFGRPDYNGSCK